MLGTKGRRVGGWARGESIGGPNYAFGPTEDEIITKHRLLTGATTTRGDPPFKKLQKKFTSFYAEIDKDNENGDDENGDDNNSESEVRLAKAFLQELSTFEIHLLKSKAVVEANLREKGRFDDLNKEIESLIDRARSEIEGLKVQLEESRAERRHKEECESVRRLITAQPPWARTQHLITELEDEITALDAENAATAGTLELRKKQFALLLHVVDELQSTIEDEQRSLVTEDTRLVAAQDQAVVIGGSEISQISIKISLGTRII